MAKFLAATKAATKLGGKVVVHREKDTNETGTMLAVWLIANEGMTAEAAIAFVRQEQPRAIDSPEQEEFLKEFCRQK